MAHSFTTFSFPSQIQRPLTFKSYEPKPQTIGKSVSTRDTRVNRDDRAFEVPLVDSVAADGPRETVNRSEPVSREPVKVVTEYACFEDQGLFSERLNERMASDELMSFRCNGSGWG